MIASLPSPPSNVIDLGILTIHAYGIMIALGVIAAIWLSGRRLEASGLGTREQMGTIAMWGVVGGIVGAIAAKNATPDGHTLFVGHKGTHSLYMLMSPKPEYDAVADFSPIGTFMVNSSILLVPATLNVNSVTDLIALFD